jgi:hypothetical protein
VILTFGGALRWQIYILEDLPFCEILVHNNSQKALSKKTLLTS